MAPGLPWTTASSAAPFLSFRNSVANLEPLFQCSLTNRAEAGLRDATADEGTGVAEAGLLDSPDLLVVALDPQFVPVEASQGVSPRLLAADITVLKDQQNVGVRPLTYEREEGAVDDVPRWSRVTENRLRQQAELGDVAILLDPAAKAARQVSHLGEPLPFRIGRLFPSFRVVQLDAALHRFPYSLPIAKARGLYDVGT